MTGEEHSFRDRAVAFAAGAAAVVLILALLATGVGEKLQAGDPMLRALAIQCILLSVIAAGVTALATLRAVEPIAGALDRIILTLRAAADGNLSASFPDGARGVLPTLVISLETLLQRFRVSLDRSEQLALTDALTGLPNRMHFERIVETTLTSVRLDNRACALLFVDLDRFKAINDSLGHARGDLLVQMVASRLRQVDSGADKPVIARLSGDEFAVLLTAAATEDIDRSARRVLQIFEQPFHFDGQAVKVGASIGVANFPLDGSDLETLLRNADAAMYHAKDQGRSRIATYAASMGERSRDRAQLEEQIREALRLNQFELHYQAQVAPSADGCIGVEALIRWRHPTLGMRPPGLFIPFAEETGLILEIGRWVAEEATRTVARWHKRGLNVRMSFNVSPVQLARPDFVGHLRHCLVASGAPPELVEVEITESLVMSNDDTAMERLTALRKLGLSVAIDDFGTGYSNLARLKQLPIDRLKIDRSLVEDIVTSQDARTIVTAIIGLAHGLGYETVAEGIETTDQHEMLGVLGCDLLQGFGIARPVEEARFLAWEAERRTPARLAASA